MRFHFKFELFITQELYLIILMYILPDMVHLDRNICKQNFLSTILTLVVIDEVFLFVSIIMHIWCLVFESHPLRIWTGRLVVQNSDKISDDRVDSTPFPGHVHLSPYVFGCILWLKYLARHRSETHTKLLRILYGIEMIRNVRLIRNSLCLLTYAAGCWEVCIGSAC